jgi:hypothetical protein
MVIVAEPRDARSDLGQSAPHIRSLPERQPNQVVLMKKPYGQLKLALGNQGPSFAGMVQIPRARFFDERMDPRWMGTIVWKGTEVT